MAFKVTPVDPPSSFKPYTILVDSQESHDDLYDALCTGANVAYKRYEGAKALRLDMLRNDITTMRFGAKSS